MDSRSSGNKLYMVILLSLFFSSVYSGFVTQDFKIRGESAEKETSESDVQQKKPDSFFEHMPTLNCGSRSGMPLVHGDEFIGFLIGYILLLSGYSGAYIAYRILGDAESKRNQAIIGVSGVAGIVAPCYALIYLLRCSYICKS